MSIDYQDGGAFAECFFVQYPNGLGRQPIAPTTVSRLEQFHAVTAHASSSSSSSAPEVVLGSRLAPTPPTPSSSLALTLVSAEDWSRKHKHTASSAPSASADDKEKEQAAAAARTQQAIAAALHAKQQPLQQRDMAESAFDGRRLGKAAAPPTTSLAIAITTPTAVEAADPTPIARSPTRAPKRSVLEVEAQQRRTGSAAATDNDGDGGGGGEHAASFSSGGAVTVPFAVSSWRNKKNLIIPVEQRIAQQRDERMNPATGGIGDRIFDLAMAMRQAEKGVSAELQQRATARAAEEERRQAALEEEEMKKARLLMEENAARLAQQQQQQHRRGETREQRLERRRLERELREREKTHKQRQRQLAKAAARLNMRVEDLEADETLLRALDRAIDPTEAAPSSSGIAAAGRPPPRTTVDTLGQSDGSTATWRKAETEGRNGGGHDDEDDGTATGRPKKSAFHMFMRPVVSNEGIAREMEALAALERSGGTDGTQASSLDAGRRGTPSATGSRSDGIKLPEADDGEGRDDDKDDSDAEDDGFAMNQLLRKRQRLL